MGQGRSVLGRLLGVPLRVPRFLQYQALGQFSSRVRWLAGLSQDLKGAVVVGGVSALGAGLVSIGIPKDSVIKYEAALKTDKFLLIVHGSPDAVYGASSPALRPFYRLKLLQSKERSAALVLNRDDLADDGGLPIPRLMLQHQSHNTPPILEGPGLLPVEFNELFRNVPCVDRAVCPCRRPSALLGRPGPGGGRICSLP